MDNLLLVDFHNRNLVLPTDFGTFCDFQRDTCVNTVYGLNEWKDSIITTIRDGIGKEFNLDETNQQKYESSRLARFLRLLSLIMQDKLIKIATSSIRGDSFHLQPCLNFIQELVQFFEQFSQPQLEGSIFDGVLPTGKAFNWQIVLS